MPRFYRVLRALVAVLLAAGALAPGTRAGTVKVAATIFPLHDIARQVAGSVADVALVLWGRARPSPSSDGTVMMCRIMGTDAEGR